jgi:hypothetical protein
MSEPLADLRRRLARRHHLIGWWGLLVFLSLGIALETLLGFKVGLYLDKAHAWRRELWRLAHAHGTLLSLVHLAFAAGLGTFGRWTQQRLKLASFFLLDALLLLPLGFFLGGIGHTEVDPSPGVLLVPIGALLLLAAVALTAWSASQGPDESGSEVPPVADAPGSPPTAASGSP